jgi:DNA-binding NtrC family response regulator
MSERESSCRARILVVDEEQWCRDFLSSVIKLLGYDEFRLVNTVPEALEALDQCPYDLVITDLRQQGYQRLLENARAQHPETRFIIMMPRRVQTQVIYYEQVDIVYKPLNMDDIIDKIRNALRQRQLRQAEEEFRRLKKEALRLFLS